MTPLLTLLDHARWSHVRVRASIDTLPADTPERAEATRLYAHVAAAAHVWCARIEGRAPAHPVWPALSLDEATALATVSLDALRTHAAADAASLARTVTYVNSSGATFTDRVGDLLTHVALHGMHHGGQIALLVRQGGGTPASTDLIVQRREAAVAAGAPTP